MSTRRHHGPQWVANTVITMCVCRHAHEHLHRRSHKAHGMVCTRVDMRVDMWVDMRVAICMDACTGMAVNACAVCRRPQGIGLCQNQYDAI